MRKIYNPKKTPVQHAVQYTVLIAILYISLKFFDITTPKGISFISYILPLLFTNIILVVFPVLLVFFYFKDGNAIDDIKNKILDDDTCSLDKNVTREELREYHGMMKEGIITEEEFNTIKKKYFEKLKEL